MSYQEAIAIPILFELTQGDITLEPAYSDLAYLHEKVAEWFPAESARLRRLKIADGTQTKEYNWIQHGIRKLAKWEPVPIEWQRRKNLAINRVGLEYLKRIVESLRRTANGNSRQAESVAKLNLNDFSRFLKKNRDTLRPSLMAFVRARHNLR